MDHSPGHLNFHLLPEAAGKFMTKVAETKRARILWKIRALREISSECLEILLIQGNRLLRLDLL